MSPTPPRISCFALSASLILLTLAPAATVAQDSPTTFRGESPGFAAKVSRQAPVPWVCRLPTRATTFRPDTPESLFVRNNGQPAMWGPVDVAWIQPANGPDRIEFGIGTPPAFDFVDSAIPPRAADATRFVHGPEDPYSATLHEQTFRPFLHLLHPQAPDIELTKGTGGQYPHHRGVFCGWSRVGAPGLEGRVNTWQGTGKTHQVVDQETITSTPGLSVKRDLVVRWKDGDRVIANEFRTHEVFRLDQRRYVVDSTYLIANPSAEGPLLLHGDPQHGGCQVRLAQELATRKDGEPAAEYIRSPDAKGGKNDVWDDCEWIAAEATIQGRKVGVLIIDHPANPGDTVWSTRRYGRFGAFAQHDVPPRGMVELKYRIVVVADPEGEDWGAHAGVYRQPPVVEQVR